MRRLQKTYIFFAILIVIVATGFFFIGRASAKKDGPDADRMPDCAAKFYATIEELNGRAFRVLGLEINDINHRGMMVFSLDENAAIWKGLSRISLEELRVGDTIAVTYCGGVWETNPSSFSDKVKKIELLRH